MSIVQTEFERLIDIASRATENNSSEPDPYLIEESVEYLSSNLALDSIEVDPYWPKWNGPWWHLMTLVELGKADLIPHAVIEHLLCVIDSRYLKFFPISLDELPAGYDPVLHIPCHCQLGSLHRLLNKCRFNAHERLPWLRDWYSKYQLADGGWNCDEAGYTRAYPKSSVVSTVPILEAVLQGLLNVDKKDLVPLDETQTRTTAEEDLKILDAGAAYLISKRLFRAQSTGQIIDETWLSLCFPRFYEYDVLRGLYFIVKWARLSKHTLPSSAITEAVLMIHTANGHRPIAVGRSAWDGGKTRYFDTPSGAWRTGKAYGYPLLIEISRVGSSSRYLTDIWNEAKADLYYLLEAGLIKFGC